MLIFAEVLCDFQGTEVSHCQYLAAASCPLKKTIFIRAHSVRAAFVKQKDGLAGGVVKN